MHDTKYRKVQSPDEQSTHNNLLLPSKALTYANKSLQKQKVLACLA